LEQHNIQVLQPQQPKNYFNVDEKVIQFHSPLINVRDFYMAYGNVFFITYGSFVSRRFQNAWIENIVNQMILDNQLVISSNEPNLKKVRFDDIPNENEEIRWRKIYKEILIDYNLYHTACILKHNNIAFCSAESGSKIGENWIKNWLLQQDIKMITANKFGHIDGSNSILNNDTILTCQTSSPIWAKYFKNIIPCPTVEEWWSWKNNQSIFKKIRNPTSWLYEFQGHFQNFNAEANALSLDPQTVMLSFYDRGFYDNLKNNYGISAIYAQWKNRHFWGGGLHCITCDVERTN
jgi:hypothetical protein